MYDARMRSSVSRYIGAQAFTIWSAVFRSSAAPSTSAGIVATVNVFDRTCTTGCGANAGFVSFGTGVRTGEGAFVGAWVGAAATVAVAPTVSDAAAVGVALGTTVCG